MLLIVVVAQIISFRRLVACKVNKTLSLVFFYEFCDAFWTCKQLLVKYTG